MRSTGQLSDPQDRSRMWHAVRRRRPAGVGHGPDDRSSHAHATTHTGHAHPGLEPEGDARRLAFALGLIVTFMGVEIVAGILGHSLVLLSDAAHTLTDAAALAMSLVVMRLVRRPAGGDLTFGLRRAEILSAQANGATLAVLAVLICYSAVGRLVHPSTPQGLVVVTVAVVGIVVNLLATMQLSHANRSSLNIEGSFQHLLTDLYAFIATAIAGGVILATGFARADALAALLVAALMLRAAFGLLRDSGRVLLEAAPAGMSVEEIGEALAAHPQVVSVHDLHVWELGTGFASLSAHVLVPPGEDCHAVRRELEQLLSERFGCDHTTLQVDHRRDGGLVAIGRRESDSQGADHPG